MSVSGYSVLFVIVRQLIPEDLTEVAPGPELARVLAGIEPTGTPTRAAGSRQIIELQIPATTLRDLADDPDPLGGWAPVIVDLAHQHTTAHQTPAGDPTRRIPGTALRRYVQIRDRHCIMIGCRAPAHSADTDHTLDHTRSGPTAEHNLGDACRHDHRVKHDGGWQLHQPKPGLFRWISPLGRRYHTRPQPIIDDLPDPIPGPEYPRGPTSDYPRRVRTHLYRPPPAPQLLPTSPPVPDTDPDEPPF